MIIKLTYEQTQTLAEMQKNHIEIISAPRAGKDTRWYSELAKGETPMTEEQPDIRAKANKLALDNGSETIFTSERAATAFIDLMNDEPDVASALRKLPAKLLPLEEKLFYTDVPFDDLIEPGELVFKIGPFDEKGGMKIRALGIKEVTKDADGNIVVPMTSGHTATFPPELEGVQELWAHYHPKGNA